MFSKDHKFRRRNQRQKGLIDGVIILLIVIGLGGCGSGQSDVKITDVPEVETLTPESALDIALSKYSQVAEQLAPEQGFPRAVENGQWRQVNSMDWTDGFFAGILWQLSRHDATLESQAERWTIPLADRASFASHDVGFIINNSFGKAFRQTGKEKYRAPIVEAANTLAGRYNQAIGAIRSWDFGLYQFPVIIDNMMNLELLFYSNSAFAEQSHYDFALSHAMVTANHHVRDNFSTFHLVDFEQSTGRVLSKQTVQGFSNDSTWARGQAWAIYGFANAYKHTGEAQFQQIAIGAADFFIANLPEDMVPYWDFSQSGIEPRDSSAAAIAAAGILLLAEEINTPSKASIYNNAAAKLVDALLNETYFDATSSTPALLKRATGNNPSNREVETQLIYADYYFIEALLRLQGI